MHSTDTYTIETGISRGCAFINLTPSAALPAHERARVFNLAHGIGMEGMNGNVIHFTPARAMKWKRLFSNGWDWDKRGFFMREGANRWPLDLAMRIISDLNQK